MKLDILALGAHPDDIEMSCTGTLLAAMAVGKKVGIVDFTRGELGTRGTPALRAEEAAAASKILGIAVRENLGMADGFFRNDREHQLPLIAAIRRYRPEVVLANAIADRHPDHGRAAQLAIDACFLAGLRMIETLGDDGQPQEAWRPKNVVPLHPGPAAAACFRGGHHPALGEEVGGYSGLQNPVFLTPIWMPRKPTCRARPLAGLWRRGRGSSATSSGWSLARALRWRGRLVCGR